MPAIRDAIVLLICLFAAAPAAAGPEDARALALYKRADRHFNVAEIDRALALYHQAYRLKPSPRYLFAIGECQRYLGQHRAALAAFTLYLRELPRAKNRALVEQRIRELSQKLAGSGSPPPPPRPPPAAADPVPEQPADGDRLHGRRAVFWTGVGLTGALLAAGIVTGQLAHDRSAAYQDPATPIAEREALKDSGERLRSAAIASFAIAGAAAIGTAVVGILWHRRARAARSAVRIEPWPGGLALTGEL